jgi:DNA-directed RNA polymerase alpha subunit
MARKYAGGCMIRIEIEDMEFAVRTYMILKRNNVNYVDQLYELSRKEISSFKNIHRKNIEEIEDKMGFKFE